jgi:CheY-like chemotaxis protein
MAAYNGRSALEIARVIPPDLLLTDVFMPGMSGIDLAVEVTQIVPDCKILLFSGQAATVDLLAAERDAGRNFSIIAKPIHPTDLLARVSETLKSPSAKSPCTAPKLSTGSASNPSLDSSNGYTAACHPDNTKSLRQA